MTVEQQLRAMADTMAMDDAPITADEVLTRRSLDVGRPTGSRVLMVAATVALVVGGLFAVLSRDIKPDEPSPVVLTPESSLPLSVTTVPEGRIDESGFANEPTLDYRDDVSWWAPTALPAGWAYGYASALEGAQTIHLVEVTSGSQIEIVLSTDTAALDEQVAGAIAENIGDQAWTVIEADGTSRLARQVDDKVLEVRGQLEPARLVAASLALTAETDLVRPPFRDDAPLGPIVHTAANDDATFEMRAHTDGLYTTIGGDIKRVSSGDPLAFGDYQYQIIEGATSTQVLVSGVALAGLDRISYGLLGGDVANAETIESDRFAEDFFALLIDVPADVLAAYESGDIELLTRWTIAEVDGQQRVYDEPGSQNCVNCDNVPSGTSDDQPEPDEPKRLTAPYVDGPTNTYRDDTMWWMPTEVPDGFEYLWAQDYGNERELYYVSTDALADPEIIPTRSDGGNIEVYVTQGEPVEQWRAWLEAGEREQVTVNGEIWLRNAAGGNALSRVVDDEFISVDAPTYDVALDVAERLEQRPETKFARPPYWFDTRVVVASLPPELGDGETPIELSAWTDGVTIDVDGQGPFFPTDEPLRFIGMTTRPASQGGATTIAAVTSPDVATVEFEQLNGDVIIIEPTDLTGRFEIGFVFVAVGIPDAAQLDPDNNYPTIASTIPSVVARNADGEVLAVISEPF